MSLTGFSKKAWLIYLFLTLIWGGAFLLIKKSLVVFNPFDVAFFRISFSFLFLQIFYWIRRPKLTKLDWIFVTLVGLVGSSIPVFLFGIAQQYIPSYLSGMLNAITPLWAALFGLLIFGIRISKQNWLGLLVGLVGTLLLFYNPTEGVEFDWHGLYVVAAAFCYGISVNIIGNKLKHLHPTDIASTSFMFIGPVAMLFVYLRSETLMSLEVNEDFWVASASVVILGIMATAVGLMLFNRLIQTTSVTFATSLTYILPIVALILGITDGEEFVISQLFGIIIVLIAVYLVKRK